ncbi:tandem-95_repeat protein [Hexamita inflata]|uniref:Tandem-95 repeat protein n=1 Tax=Hexamita inflata TaxID=28002 RepID=A0AA86R281_9EUKA|nr:tandem-95 repeat protein [Hexamita inflata]
MNVKQLHQFPSNSSILPTEHIQLKENENIECSLFVYKALDLINKDELEESIMKIIVSINGSNLHYIMIDSIDNLTEINQTMCIAKTDSKVNFEVEIGGFELINNLIIQQYSQYFHCNMQNSEQVLSDANFRKLSQVLLLALNNSNPDTLQKIQYLHNIFNLNLAYNNLQDMQIFKHHPGLRSINASNNEIISLQDICNTKSYLDNSLHFGLRKCEFSALTKLVLYCNKLTDVSCIANIKQLKTVDLSCNQIINIDALTQLMDLEYLFVSENRIVYICSDFLQLKKLKQFYVDNNYLVSSNISQLQQMRNALTQDNNDEDFTYINQKEPSQQLILQNKRIIAITQQNQLKQQQFINDEYSNNIKHNKAKITQWLQLETQKKNEILSKFLQILQQYNYI